MAGGGRPLGALEYVVAIADRAAPINFVMVADLRGPVAEAGLRAALDVVQRRHPLLGMALAPHGRRLRFAPGAGPIPLAVVEAPKDAVPGLCADEATRRLPEEAGPLLRATWVRGVGERSTLLLTFHHSIGDGTAGALLVRDLMQALAGEAGEAPLPAALEDHLPPATVGARGVVAHLGFLGRVFRRLARLRGVPGYRVDGAPRADVGACRIGVARRDLDPAASKALAAAARAEGTTVHGLLGAALLEAAFAVSDRRPVVGFGSPVNLRGRLMPPVGDDVGLFITMVASLHRLDPMPGFWDLARDIRGQLGEMIDSGDVFSAIPFQGRGLARLAPWLGRGVVGARRFVRVMRSIWLDGIGLSNLGRLSIEARYGAVSVEAVGFCAAPTVFGDLAAFAATLDGRMCLHWVGVTPHIPPAALDAIVNGMMARLHRVAGAAEAGRAA